MQGSLSHVHVCLGVLVQQQESQGLCVWGGSSWRDHKKGFIVFRCVLQCAVAGGHQDGLANKQKRFSSWVSEWPQGLGWILVQPGSLKVGYLRAWRVHDRYWRNHWVWGGHSLAPRCVYSFEPGSTAWLSHVCVWGSWARGLGPANEQAESGGMVTGVVLEASMLSSWEAGIQGSCWAAWVLEPSFQRAARCTCPFSTNWLSLWLDKRGGGGVPLSCSWFPRCCGFCLFWSACTWVHTYMHVLDTHVYVCLLGSWSWKYKAAASSLCQAARLGISSNYHLRTACSECDLQKLLVHGWMNGRFIICFNRRGFQQRKS